MLRRYGITVDKDAGLTLDELANHCEREPSPNAFVEWFASKYDLMSRDEWMAYR